jgi:hypothetical protein
MCSTRQYQPFQWLYPGAYQPLQPAAVLLIDLMKEPQSAEAAQSKTLLETIFSLLGPEGRVAGIIQGRGMRQSQASSGARQAWSRLENLRKKVWKTLGLDSSVVWSRSLSDEPVQGGGAENGSLSRAWDVPDQTGPVATEYGQTGYVASRKGNFLWLRLI